MQMPDFLKSGLFLHRTYVVVILTACLAVLGWIGAQGYETDKGRALDAAAIDRIKDDEASLAENQRDIAHAIAALSQNVPTRVEFEERCAAQDRRITETLASVRREIDDLKRERWYESHKGVEP